MALPRKNPAQRAEGLLWVSPAPSPADAKVPRPWVPVVGRPWVQGVVATAERFWPGISTRFGRSHWRSLLICSSTCKATFGEVARSSTPTFWFWAALPLTPAKSLGAGWLLTSVRNKIWHPQPSPVIPVPCSWMQGPFGDPSLPVVQLSVGPPGRDAGPGNIPQLPSKHRCQVQSLYLVLWEAKAEFQQLILPSLFLSQGLEDALIHFSFPWPGQVTFCPL